MTEKHMLRGTVFWAVAFFLLAHELAIADSALTDRIAWKKAPIRLDLRVDHERLVHFPASVKVGVPARLQPLLRAQNVDGTVYLLARGAFAATRLMVREVDSGQIYLLDLSASQDKGQIHPVQIYAAERTHAESEQADAPAGRGHHTGLPQYGYVALTRFAAQQLYAPGRLLQDTPGIVRIPVARDPVDLVRGGAIQAAPLVAWRAGNLYLTAVKLSNRTHKPQILDPRHLRGAWLTAAFQHNRLLPAGDEADTTAVYLISARPFEASL